VSWRRPTPAGSSQYLATTRGVKPFKSGFVRRATVLLLRPEGFSKATRLVSESPLQTGRRVQPACSGLGVSAERFEPELRGEHFSPPRMLKSS
jgi:hypothetical protein